MSSTSTIKSLSPVRVELAIDVPATDVSQALDRAYAKISREARIRGFRKGKVPRAVLRRMFGKALLGEVRGEVVTRALLEALKEHEVEPISEPEIEAGELAEGVDYHFTVKVESSPRLEQVDYEGIEVERRRVEVDAQRIDAEIARLRSAVATAVDLEQPRPAAAGDLVRFDAQRWVEGNWSEERLPVQDIVLEEGAGPDKLVEALTGLAVGEDKVVDFGEQTGTSERNRLLVKVISIQERRLPEVDDEFAKDLGEFDTLAELRADIERRLRESLTKSEDERLKHEVFEKLREKNPMELPATLLEEQAQAFKAQFQGLLKSEPDEEQEAAAQQKLDEGAAGAARDIVHLHFLTREIARLEQLEVGDEDLDAELSAIAERAGVPLPKVRAELGQGEQRDQLMNRLLERKVFDFVLARVKINEVDPPAPQDGDDKE